MPNEDGTPTVEELKAKAYQPMEDAMKLHPFYHGKIETTLKCCVRDFQDFGIWYTPGVSAPCLDIKDDPEKVYEHTNKGNTVAVISDGTRVLGMGDIGPKAGLPVMEGKSLLYKYLGGVDGFPLMVDTKDPDKLIEFVKLVQPGLGGVNLEDIAQPKCFRILDTLREECEIPVWHDDQQGTACVTLAGLVNALKVDRPEDRRREDRLHRLGRRQRRHQPPHLRLRRRPGQVPRGRQQGHPPQGPRRHRGRQGRVGRQVEVLPDHQRRAAAGRHRRGAQGRRRVHRALASRARTRSRRTGSAAMAPDPIVFLCANPIPEMWPWDAKEAGAAVVATGRSDFPNQVNNSVGFPGIFRGTLDVRAKTITDEMCIAAAVELAKVAEDKGLSADYIMPTMDDWEVFPREAAAVAMKAIEQGIALRTDLTFEQEVAEATAIIARARGMVQDQMALGYIPMPEGSRAPAPTKAAIKAAARGGVDYAGELADRAVDAIGPAAQKAADAAQRAADKAAEAIKKATERKKDS